MSFKKNTQENFEKLTKELEKASNKTNKDERLWTLDVDKAGNGYAIIRFLPGLEEDLSFVKIYDHYFQEDGGWYVEKSLTTIGEDDPCGPMLKKLWSTGSEADKNIARKRKRRTNFYANILVVNDPANPENDGNVFLFKYGSMIQDIIQDQINPQSTIENPNPKPCNPFDAYQGKNFKYRLRSKDDYKKVPDKSEFEEKCSAISDNDELLDSIYNKQYALKPMIDPSEFKSYEELEKQLNKVLYGPSVAKKASESLEKEAEPSFPVKEANSFESSSQAEDGDDDLDMFKSLLDDDEIAF